MTTTEPQKVLSASDARKGLNSTLERFRREGVNAEPVVFGSHRKPEAVMIPYECYQQMLIDIASPTGVEIEYEGPMRSYTKTYSMGNFDAVEAVKLIYAEDDARQIRILRGER